VLEANVQRVLSSLRDEDLVLDVGGWASPFNRAQWVVDSQPWETRGFYRTFGGPASQGGDREWFTRETWVQRDICDHQPWPFADNQFDFVICSHTLEDVRDPLRVCAEMIRVARGGYIEVPSRVWESTLGVEHPRMAGLSHHRWMVDIEGTRVRFHPKYHLLHADWRFSLPARHLRRLSAEQAVQWLFWRGTFEYEEVFLYGTDAVERELAGFAAAAYPRPKWQYRAHAARRRFGSLLGRVRARVGRG